MPDRFSSRLCAIGLAALLAGHPLHIAAQRQVSDSTTRRPLFAAGEVVFINFAVNRVDAWPLAQDWARVTPKDWSRNLRLGWEWDENQFGTNMFSHPYHGAMYFNSGRSNGLTYWESAPLAFLGSWNWEYFGEKFRPSLNDFFMTSFGGIALGEVFHRVSASIRDNRSSGSRRLLREIAAMPLDPVGSVNRIVHGDWKRIGANPLEHNTAAYVFRIHAGGRVAPDSGRFDGERLSKVKLLPTIMAELYYGDAFATPYAQPFDVFTMRTQISGTSLNILRASGRLYSRDLNRYTARNRHVFAVNQRYDFANNAAHKFGGQSVEVGLYSRWHLSKTAALRTQIFADGVLLGALDAPFTGFGERTYDFGPGIGIRTEYAYERRGVTYVTLWGRTEYIHSVSGASADHNVSFGGTEITIPLPRGLGFGFQTGYYERLSRYSDRPNESRSFPEMRIFLTWTASAVSR